MLNKTELIDVGPLITRTKNFFQPFGLGFQYARQLIHLPPDLWQFLYHIPELIEGKSSIFFFHKPCNDKCSNYLALCAIFADKTVCKSVRPV